MIKDIELSNGRGRTVCWTCRQPEEACYCGLVNAFDSRIQFVILIHKIESRRRIATGRMSHLILKNSHLIEGVEYSTHPIVNRLLAQPDVYPVVLYPGKNSVDLTFAAPGELATLVPSGKRLLVFVVDGTWATARRTMRLSTNLNRLPRVCFSPTKASQFKVRKQPAEFCLSTLEAIHHTIELLGESQGFDVKGRGHDHLLDVFSSLVERQLSHVPKAYRPRGPVGPNL